MVKGTSNPQIQITMTEQTLANIAEKAGVTIPDITALCTEYLESDIKFMRKFQLFLDEEKKRNVLSILGRRTAG